MRTLFLLASSVLLLTPSVAGGQSALIPAAERHRYPPPQQESASPDSLRRLVASALAVLGTDPRVERVGGHALAGCRHETRGGIVTRGQWTRMPDGRTIYLELTVPRTLADSGRTGVIELAIGAKPDEHATGQAAGLSTQLTLIFDAFFNHYTSTTDADRAPLRWDMYPATDPLANELRRSARQALARPCQQR